MIEGAHGDALGDIAARLDEIVKEVRRQGRAAIAAQAAAEACLEQVTALAQTEDDLGEAAAPVPGPVEDLGWLDALLPVADALDRAVVQASGLVERRSRSAWARFWPFVQPAASDAELKALVEGLRVLQAQLAAAFESSGVTVDRRVGVAVDPEVHRVVEVRPPREEEPEGLVVEVVRPGYAAVGRVVREADVVATGALQEPAR